MPHPRRPHGRWFLGVVLAGAVSAACAVTGRARADVLPTWGAEWHSTQRATATLGLLLGDARGGGFDLGRHLLLLRASPGLGGGRLGLGWAPYAAGSSGLVFAGVALEATLLRTWGSPSGVPPDRTYVGAQLDVAFVLKGSVGVLRRVGGAGSKDTLVTWCVGFGL